MAAAISNQFTTGPIHPMDALTPLVQHLREEDAAQVRRAWEFALTLYGSLKLSTGEAMTTHALGIAQILDAARADAPARASGVLFSAGSLLARPEEQLVENFGRDIGDIVLGVRKLARLGEQLRKTEHSRDPKEISQQIETLRKMLLAFATDIRVVLVRLASRLQTLRYFAQTKLPLPAGLARESLDLYAPLANRLGVWQIKWELEDLSYRFLEPEDYKRVARMLDQKRIEREAFIENTITEVRRLLSEAHIEADVSGRPKHIYSIVSKMRSKRVDFANLYDVRGLRVIVEDERTCYSALSIIHARWTPLQSEFDDYIARPKPNGYRSLHTVVQDETGRPFEVQIRTSEMHRFAEYGVAAHWRYKEKAGPAQDGYDDKIAWLRQLLAWKNEVTGSVVAEAEPDIQGKAESLLHRIEPANLLDDRIYVLTPQARVIELPTGATPVDFAYHVHTDLGHRCRGARVDGVMVPLTTVLKNGQTVEILATRTGGPSRDWLNMQHGYLQSQRSRAKVRQWFNALDQAETAMTGRALVEKLLQREGKTSVSHEELARKLDIESAEQMFIAIGKEELSLRQIEVALGLRQVVEADHDAITEDLITRRGLHAVHNKSGVLVVGVDALLTQLAKCCKPAPPDEIIGFVTRGKGVSIHRVDCRNFAALQKVNPERVIETQWGQRHDAVYPVDVLVIASDRQGLLRDISEVFSREKINVVGVNTESKKGIARMSFTAEVTDANQLKRALSLIAEVGGVQETRRK